MLLPWASLVLLEGQCLRLAHRQQRVMVSENSEAGQERVVNSAGLPALLGKDPDDLESLPRTEE